MRPRPGEHNKVPVGRTGEEPEKPGEGDVFGDARKPGEVVREMRTGVAVLEPNSALLVGPTTQAAGDTAQPGGEAARELRGVSTSPALKPCWLPILRSREIALAASMSPVAA